MESKSLEPEVESEVDNSGEVIMEVKESESKLAPIELDTVVIHVTDNVEISMKQLEELVKSIKKTYKKITKDNVIRVLMALMVTVKRMTKLTGRQKKALVIQTVKTMVKDDKELILYIDVYASDVIEGLIDTSRGLYEFTSKKMKSSGFLCCG